MITDILIEPVGAQFDVARVSGFLEAMSHVARDPIAGEEYFVASDARQLREALKARIAQPKSFPTSIILIAIRANCVDISFRISRVEPARRLVEFLRKEYEVKIMDDEFHDLMAQCGDDLGLLFGPRAAS